MKLPKKYKKFLDAVERPDKYTNPDHVGELIKHFGMSEKRARSLYDEWIRQVFINLPWKPPDD